MDIIGPRLVASPIPPPPDCTTATRALSDAPTVHPLATSSPRLRRCFWFLSGGVLPPPSSGSTGRCAPRLLLLSPRQMHPLRPPIGDSMHPPVVHCIRLVLRAQGVVHPASCGRLLRGVVAFSMLVCALCLGSVFISMHPPLRAHSGHSNALRVAHPPLRRTDLLPLACQQVMALIVNTSLQILIHA